MKTTKSKTLKFNNFFDKGLYLEATRQLKILGIVSVVLSAAASILVPLYILFMILYNGGMMLIAERNLPFDFLRDCHNIIEANYIYQGLITLILLIYVPVACLMLFNFLTRRNACDYFHSFPQKRGCIYITYVLAILTWGYGIVLAYTVSSLVIYTALTYFFNVSLLYVLQYSLYLIAATTLGVTTICFACSLTGTVFTNVIISGILLFLPRIFIITIGAFLTSTSDVFVSSHFTLWSEFDTNLIFSFISRIFSDLAAIFTGKIELPSFISFAYTSVLAIIYFIAGKWFFIKRHSEAAGKPADSRFTRFILRICIGMPFALAAIILALGNIYFEEGLDPVAFFFIIVLEIVGMAAIFIYEMISTKSFNVLLRVLPALPAFVVIQVCIVLISCGIEKYESSFKPTGKDMNYVTIKAFDDEIGLSFGENYFDRKFMDYRLYNDELKDYISKALIADIDDFDDDVYNHEESCPVTLAINTGIVDKYRTIYLTEEENEEFMALIFKEEDFRKHFLEIPAFNKNNLYMYDEGLYEIKGHTTDYSGYRRVYNALREELKTVDPVEFYELVHIFRYTYLSLDGNINSVDFNLPITGYTPKSLMEYMNTVNDSDINSPALIGKLQSELTSSYTDTSIEIGIFNEDFTYLEYSLNSFAYDYYENIDKVSYLAYYNEALDQLRISCTEEITELSKDGYVLVEYSTWYGDREYRGYGYIEKELINTLTDFGTYDKEGYYE